jgi:HD-like signal output (HDOD) protein
LLDHDDLLRAANDLEPLSQTALKLMRLFSDEQWLVDDVIAAVAFDAPLTARILRCANSAASSGVSRVGSLEQAILRMGSGIVVRIAVGVAVRGTMSVSIPELKAPEGALWRHDVASAVVTEMIPLVRRKAIPAEAFTASLLHDIGRVIMYENIDEGTMRLIEAARKAGETAVVAERTILGVDHGEIGALIAQSWNLPDCLVHTIRLHEEPDSATDHKTREICDIVKVSDAGAHRLGFETGESVETEGHLADSLDRLGLDHTKFDELCSLAGERYEEIRNQFE